MQLLWRGMGEDFDPSWSQIRGDAAAVVAQGRAAAASTTLDYTASVLAETGQRAPATAGLNPERFLATAPDGLPVDTMLDRAPIVAKQAIAKGATISSALEAGGAWLTQAILSAIADTSRAITAADIAVRPGLGGYVRQLEAPSCSRCVILAGKWFRWNEGFLRHPRCDCRHIPASEDVAGDPSTDPYAYFNSLSAAEQDKAFGRSEARAIRLGGDIFRVVNIQNRGLSTSRAGRRLGTPSRMTVDDILRTAGTHTNARRMLAAEGYITGPQTRDGFMGGRMRERFAGMTSVPRAGSARERVLTARQTGVRDPLDPATMTAAERRLFDANYRLEYARRYGVMPRSIGPNSADVAAGITGRTITAQQLAELEDALARQLGAIRPNQRSLTALAEALGLGRGGDSAAVFARVDAQMLERFRSATRTTR